jgi:hypothetical protein
VQREYQLADHDCDKVAQSLRLVNEARSRVPRAKVGQCPGMSPNNELFGQMYGQGVKGAFDYVLVVILGCVLVASLLLVAIVVFSGSPF